MFIMEVPWEAMWVKLKTPISPWGWCIGDRTRLLFLWWSWLPILAAVWKGPVLCVLEMHKVARGNKQFSNSWKQHGYIFGDCISTSGLRWWLRKLYGSTCDVILLRSGIWCQKNLCSCDHGYKNSDQWTGCYLSNIKRMTDGKIVHLEKVVILLLGGKGNRWKGWYVHLKQLRMNRITPVCLSSALHKNFYMSRSRDPKSPWLRSENWCVCLVTPTTATYRSWPKKVTTPAKLFSFPRQLCLNSSRARAGSQ